MPAHDPGPNGLTSFTTSSAISREETLVRTFSVSLLVVFLAAAGVLVAQVRTATSTSSVSSAAGIPSGYSILGDTAVSPPGYSLHGTIETGGTWAFRRTFNNQDQLPSVATANGKFYVISPNGTTQEYDPIADSWTSKSPNPFPASIAPAASANNKVYVFGGIKSGVVGTVQRYDPATDSWATMASMPTARYGMGVAEVSGSIYVVGGYESTQQSLANEVYDPSTNTWSTKAPVNEGHLFPAAISSEGKIYVVGPGSVDTEEFDPVSNTWTLRSPFPSISGALSGGVLNGQIVVLDGSGQRTMAYDTSNDQWDDVAILPVNKSFSTVGSNEAGLFSFGGQGPGSSTLQLIPRTVFYIHQKN
jgi:hypothetical protein